MFPTRTLLSSDESDGLIPWSATFPVPLFAPHGTSSREVMDDLTATLHNWTFDMDAIGRELHRQTRDTDQIRRDFLRNGIDSSLAGKRPCRPPVGFYGEPVGYGGPLASLENRQAAVGAVNGFEDSGESSVTSAGSRGRVHRPPRRKQKENEDYCVFCFNNHEPEEVYLGHALYDNQGVQCPRLRQYVCPYCHATDRKAHTKKYCPSKPIITPEDLAMQQQKRTATVSNRVIASATALFRACQPSITPGGGKRALRF